LPKYHNNSVVFLLSYKYTWRDRGVFIHTSLCPRPLKLDCESFLSHGVAEAETRITLVLFEESYALAGVSTRLMSTLYTSCNNSTFKSRFVFKRFRRMTSDTYLNVS